MSLPHLGMRPGDYDDETCADMYSQGCDYYCPTYYLGTMIPRFGQLACFLVPTCFLVTVKGGQHP